MQYHLQTTHSNEPPGEMLKIIFYSSPFLLNKYFIINRHGSDRSQRRKILSISIWLWEINTLQRSAPSSILLLHYCTVFNPFTVYTFVVGTTDAWIILDCLSNRISGHAHHIVQYAIKFCIPPWKLIIAFLSVYEITLTSKFFCESSVLCCMKFIWNYIIET